MQHLIFNNNGYKFAVVGVLLSGLLVGCGGVPNKDSLLADARQTFEMAQNDVNVTQKAGNALYDAEKALQKAEGADNADDMQHLAYLAKQQALIAIEVANRKVAEAEREQLAEQSKDIVIMSRTQEAERKAREAEMALERLAIEKAEVEALRKELADLKAKQTDKGLVLTLGDVLFETGKANLLGGALNEINKVAQFVNQHSNRNILVEGHTDNVGSEDYNMGLSQRRADAVKFALLERGVASTRILSKGWGESRPVASNSAAYGRQQNRRVEITILNEGNALPAF